jgi:hypothetical protein
VLAAVGRVNRVGSVIIQTRHLLHAIRFFWDFREHHVTPSSVFGIGLVRREVAFAQLASALRTHRKLAQLRRRVLFVFHSGKFELRGQLQLKLVKRSRRGSFFLG